MTASAEETELMRHALGLNRQAVPFRNHFVCAPGSTDYPAWEAMFEKGWATRRGPGGLGMCAEDFIYHVTEAGRAAAGLPPAGRQ